MFCKASISNIHVTHKPHRPDEPRDGDLSPFKLDQMSASCIENFDAYTAEAIEDTPGAIDFPESGESCCNVQSPPLF